MAVLSEALHWISLPFQNRRRIARCQEMLRSVNAGEDLGFSGVLLSDQVRSLARIGKDSLGPEMEIRLVEELQAIARDYKTRDLQLLLSERKQKIEELI